MMRTECTPNKEENHQVVPFECELGFCEKGGREGRGGEGGFSQTRQRDKYGREG